MNKSELIAKLEKIKENSDTEVAHADADEALLEFINDAEIREAYEKIEKWYA